MSAPKEVAVFGGGCFWCTEAVFQMLKGVVSVDSGYAGGAKPNPTYEEVSGGRTGHAEVVRIVYEPALVSYEDLLTVFFATHDPTTLNRQGADVGTQYRSIILYSSAAQKESAERFIARLNEDGPRVVTEVKPLGEFFPAEAYHLNFYRDNPNAPYCRVVINPKLEKLQARFGELMK